MKFKVSCNLVAITMVIAYIFLFIDTKVQSKPIAMIGLILLCLSSLLVAVFKH